MTYTYQFPKSNKIYYSFKISFILIFIDKINLILSFNFYSQFYALEIF
jgi:hypothetical protein